MRTSKDALIDELKVAGAKIRGKTVKCPFHEDRTPSGGVYQDAEGVWRYKCHAAGCGFCGDLYDVKAKATNQPLDRILKESNPNPPKASQGRVYESIEAIEATIANLEARHTYTNPTTKRPDLIVLRYRDNGKKRFMQISPNGRGFVMKAPPKPWPIYNRIELQSKDVVIVVEGEKCVHALRRAGMAGTTSPCGAGKAQYANWKPLAGKTVYLWPDNDNGGIEHMEDVAGILDNLEPAPTVFRINPADLKLPAGGDVVDFLALHESDLHHSAIQTVLENAEPIGASKEVRVLIEDTIAGRREAIGWPWPAISKLTRSLLPKTVTLICGDPGAAKSFFLLQAMAHWFDKGVKVAVFELEEDRAYHLNRALAQRADKADLFDSEWIRDNPDESRDIFDSHKEFLDGFGRCIYAAPEKQTTLNELAEWVEARAKDGCRIIAIDPVTAVASIRDTWVADSAFMFQVKAIARNYGVSVVLVTHPRKGRKTAIGLDELAGGAAYQRFSQCVIWLERHKQEKNVTIASPVGRSSCEINWTAHLIKTRNGAGAGLGIGLNFYGESLKFGEQGVVIPEKKE